VDVYSFAIVLWQIITTQLPYEKELGVDDPYKVTVQTTFLPSNLRPSLKSVESEELQKLLKTIWQDHPDRRPSSEEVVLMLEEIAGPEKVPIENVFPELKVKNEVIPKEEKVERKKRIAIPDMAWWSAIFH